MYKFCLLFYKGFLTQPLIPKVFSLFALSLLPTLAIVFETPIFASAQPYWMPDPPSVDHSPTISFYIKIIVAAVILSLLIWGLNNSMANEPLPEHSQSEKLVKKFLESIRSQDFNRLPALFMAEYFQHQQLTNEDLAATLAAQYEQLGSLHDFRLMDMTERKEMVEGKPSIYYELKYVCTYANDSTNETFIVRQPPNCSGLRITNVDIAPHRLVLKSKPSY